MFLKKLELFGFKSFPHKTSLEFEPGITAIVGPNGCGKSNISDAVKWVLGEQSAKQMRGERMGDVLFNGASALPPYNLAEVTITFDNNRHVLPIEYNEVSISRRITRSGDSEYLINKNQCRLKDIHQLFFGTGVGTSAYSVIEQGRIGQILNMKPEDRRYIFEEAAGITKYKANKKEALRKLQATEDNLLRVADITAEIKRQLNSITRQVNKTRRYNEVFTALKELELKVFYYEMQQLHQEITSIIDEKKSLRDTEELLITSATGKEANREEFRNQLIELSDDIQKMSDRYVEADKTISLIESKIDFSKDRIHEIEENSHRIHETTQTAGQKICDLRYQIESVENNLKELKTQQNTRQTTFDSYDQELKVIQSALNNTVVQLEGKDQEMLNMTGQMATLRNEIGASRVSSLHIEQRKERISREHGNQRREQTRIAEELVTVKAQLQNFQDDIRQHEDQQLALACDIEANTSFLEQTQKALDEELKERDMARSRLEILSEWKKTHEGYVDGVKAACQMAQDLDSSFGHVYGPLAGLLTLDQKYSLAIESALRDQLEMIVADHPQVVKQLVDGLVNQAKGHAKFLIKSKAYAVHSNLSATVLDKTGVCGRAIQFVRFDESFQGIFESLLSDTLVVENYDIAEEILSSGQWRGPIVTMRGECFTLHGAVVSGGSPDAKSKDLLMRDTEMIQLSERISEADHREQEFHERLSSVRESLESRERDKLDLEFKLGELKQLGAGIEKEASRLQWESKQSDDELFILNADLDDLNKNLQEYLTLKECKEAKLKELTCEEEELQDSSQRMRGQMIEYRERIDRIKIKMGDLRVDLASIQEKITGDEERVNRLCDQLEEECQEKGRRAMQLQELECRKENVLMESGELQIKLRDLRAETQESKIQLDEKKSTREHIEFSMDNEMAGLKHAQQELRKIQEKLSGLEVRETEVRMTTENRDEMIQTAYHTRFASLGEEFRVESIAEEWSGQIEEMKKKIEAMGPINQAAIEENEELESRYHFLVEQQEDLLQAKESLQKVIRKINATTKKQFAETFEAVKQHFTAYFKILFDGGHAELILVDEENVLESGVDIIARPPGKKLQSISLLSGGEKAMTAIAILFALFKVRPSPFCILDEIDAPLDDANIDRFVTLLKEFIADTQFIIISHNKKTIAIADILYGITMEIPGISRVISVKLIESEESKTKELSA